MTWFKVDDQFADHPKFLRLSDAAGMAWFRSLAYASRYLTDGFIPDGAVTRLSADPGAVSELADCGLLLPADGGWMVANYLEHQRSRERIERERNRDRKRKGIPAGNPPGNPAGIPRPELETETDSYSVCTKETQQSDPQPVDNARGLALVKDALKGAS